LHVGGTVFSFPKVTGVYVAPVWVYLRNTSGLYKVTRDTQSTQTVPIGRAYSFTLASVILTD